MTAGRYYDMANPLGRSEAPGAVHIGGQQLILLQIAWRSATGTVIVHSDSRDPLAAAQRLVDQGLLDYEPHGYRGSGMLYTFSLTETGRTAAVMVKHVPKRGHGATQRRRRR